MSLFRLIRYKNLMIIILTQGLMFFGFFQPVLLKNSLTGNIFIFDFILLTGFTVWIAAAGYVINDLLDVRPDSINKPEKLIIGKSISKNSGLILYVVLLLIGLLTGIIMDLRYQSIRYSIIHLLISLGLVIYSLKLKKMPLAGNAVIAVFSAMVPLIMLLFFENNLSELSAEKNAVDHRSLIFLVLAYSIFAFLTSLIREIIKDMEDMEGDGRSGINSTAVVLGLFRSKQIALFISMVLEISLIICIWFSFSYDQLWIIRLLPIVLLLILIYISIRMAKATTKPDFTRLSAELKYFMLAGLICLLILSFLQFG